MKTPRQKASPRIGNASVSLLAALLLLTGGALRGADWPQFRGPLCNGVSDESAIILTRSTATHTGSVQNGPLRFPDEFVRHKVLDLIGDLALFGKRILGYVKADRAGHALHTAIVSRILRDQSYAEEITLSEDAVADWPEEHLAVAD